ncbi:putative tetratricopeptide-like helical domain superfamily [Dioscorea sansibarensis]
MQSRSPTAIAAHHKLHQILKHFPKSWTKPLPSKDQPSLRSAFATIQLLCSNGHLSQAFKAFSFLLHIHSPPPCLLQHPISSLLSCSTTLTALSPGLQLHARCITLGIAVNPFLISRLTSFYSALGLLRDALLIVISSNIKRAWSWNLLISAYCHRGLWREAIIAFAEMVGNGVEVDKYTYASVLSACGEILDFNFGRLVHKCIVCCGLELDLFVHNALVSMYAKCGDFLSARNVFDRMPERDVVSWNSMISGYLSKGIWAEAFELVERMRIENVEVNSVTRNAVLGGNLRMGNYVEVLKLISQMRKGASVIDFVTLIIGLNACSRIGDVKLGREIHAMLVRMGCDLFENVQNALITMYSRCDDTVHAYVLFRINADRSLVCWNAMVAGFAHTDQVKETCLVFQELLACGMQPNYVTMVTILSLCARVADLHHGRELHCYIMKHRFEGDGRQLLSNSLLDMYSKSGRMLSARNVFEMMEYHDEVSYTSLIAGYGMQGDGAISLKLFNRMIEWGIEPDHITMVAILSACSHSGLVTQGQMLFDKMVSLYGIVPRMEHYSCMVDLFGRVGLLRKAEEILIRMPFPASTAMLATLIGACQAHGNIEIGKRAADKLLEMKPQDPRHYVLITSMYVSAKCQEGVVNVRTLMRDMGIWKAPSWASIELDGKLYPFLAGKKSNPNAPAIYQLLFWLMKHLKDAGYVGNEEVE